MKNITTPQIQKIHVVLNQLGLLGQKKEMVLALTEGRTESTKDLSQGEAIDFIKYLVSLDPREKHIKAIHHLAYKAGIIYGDTPDDYKMNAAKINKFLRERGAVRKELNRMNLEELKMTHRQFEGMLRNNHKSSNNKKAKQATDQLLAELNLTVKS